WDTLYAQELTNHSHDRTDTGTVWFDDSDAETKTLSFLEEHASADYGLDPATASVLDLGCGNGSLLFALRDEGWEGRLVGVDYSEGSVELARAVGRDRLAEAEDAEEEENEVEFLVWDVLAGPLDAVRPTATTTANTQGWDLVLDKGTFDAISLSDARDPLGRRVCEGYGARVLALLRAGGIFLVTSCNWTEAELREWFDGKTVTAEEGTETAKLRLAGRIQYPSFSFGGVKGQTISTLCFEKVVGA
ncbi:S-adenosyl-L-methionine-dependent methyltransferase, partial [Staphylotrichum tortipilum]